ncbi:hypothetical protein PIIN_05933 [Serendipita indica DSM 11827]|uniref:Uncharacterized protein n=1 Tax=Serendipita indica (strain DSM 11827) TaxID=1109443 RepID=G4TL01_SERID|nr:hypothetical protein PIIN_05933 [Serendipita indica DSM 11827]
MRVGFFAVLFASAVLLGTAAPLPNPMKGPATHAKWAEYHRSEAAKHAESARQFRDVAEIHGNHAWMAAARGYDNSSDVRLAESNRKLSKEHADAAAKHRNAAKWHSQQNPHIIWSPSRRRSIEELD